jgi:glycerol-3-phosphate O-acyltransferase
LIAALDERFFSRIEVDPAWIREIQKASARGALVHVLGRPSLPDFLALDYLARRHALPPIRFVSETRMRLLHASAGQSPVDLLLPRSEPTELRTALRQGGSAVVFLRDSNSPQRVPARAGVEEGEDLLFTLFELQRKQSEPILLLPQVFVWTKRPEPDSIRPTDLLLEPREWPNAFFSVAQFLINYQSVTLRMGEPLELGEVLRDPDRLSDTELGRKVAFTILRRLDRERRAVTGPAEKAPDRVRHEIMRSPRLRAAIEDLAGEREQDRAVLRGQVMAMLRELQAVPDTTARMTLGLLFRGVFERAYAGFEVDPEDVERVRQASRQGMLVLLPSHKSYFDYLFLSYIFNQLNLPMPLIAAGDNLNFFPAGALLRRGGAFFIRRSFGGDRLYAAVVDAYIRRLIRDGHPIEVYLEGTRSRTGKLLAPKFGLLNMIVDACLAVSQQAAFFVPISIGYEHLVDARAHQRELIGGEKTKENAKGLLKARSILRHRYGRINLQMGQILTLREVSQELGYSDDQVLTPAKRRALVTRLGNRSMDEINRVTSVTPGSLTALVLLNDPPRRESPHRELYLRARRLLGVLQSMGARVSPAATRASSTLDPEAFREALQMFLDAELVSIVQPGGRARRRFWSSRPRAEEDATYRVPDGGRLALDTSKNMNIHFFVERSLVAIAVLMGSEPPELSTVQERVRKLSRLLKHEFRFHADASFEQIFQRTVAAMLEAGELSELGGSLDSGPGGQGWSGRSRLVTYANILKNFLEGYRVAARTAVSLTKGPASEKELVKRALALGPRMLSAGDIERREAISKPIFENAFLALLDGEYLRRNGDRLELIESLCTPKAAAAIEGRIAAFSWDSAR